MKKVILAAIGALSLLAVAPARAADLPAPTPHQLELSRQVMELSGQQSAVQDNIRSTISNLLASELGANDPRSKKIVDRATAIIMPQLMNRVETVYAQVYSEQELTDILAFYQSPAGQAMLAKLPQVLKQSQEAGAALAPQFVQALQDAAKGSDL